MRGPHLLSSCLRLLNVLALSVCVLAVCAQNPSSLILIIKDENGRTLTGVTLISKNWQAVSDVTGKIEVSDFPLDTFHLSYLGYKDQFLTYEELVAKNGVIEMTPQLTLVEEVVVIGRNNARQNEITQQVETITRNDLRRSASQTSADALEQNAQVFVQKSQMGGGSPIIRGFEANKVLLVVDGVRMNNAIYRSGHLQNAITVSSSILEQMEVIYGPGSLMYGSDALGGVVHFRTLNPQLVDGDHPTIKQQALIRYASANHEKTAHYHAELGHRKWASLTSVTYSDFADLRTGNLRSVYPDFGKRQAYVEVTESGDQLITNPNPNVQVGTGYSQFDLMQKLIFQPRKNVRYIANFQYSNSSDIPRYDLLTEMIEPTSSIPTYAEWNYGPQKRSLISLKGQYGNKRRLFDQGQWIIAHQKILEERKVRFFMDVWRNNQLESLDVLSANADFTKSLSSALGLNLDYGLEWLFNQLASTAFDRQISTQEIRDEVSTRYPNGDNSMQSQSAYAILRKANQQKTIQFHVGLRYSLNQLKVRYMEGDGFSWPDFFYEGVANNNSQLTSSIGLKISTTNHWTINVMASTAFRSPNIDDFAKFRIKGVNVSVPNLDLLPEKSQNIELNFRKQIKAAKKIAFNGALFYTRLSNAIIRADYSLPNGDRQVVINGRNYHVQANINANKAVIYGTSFNLTAELIPSLSLEGGISYIRGISQPNQEDEAPLAHIPPVYGSTRLVYSSKIFESSLVWRYHGAKPLDLYAPGSSDNEEYATPVGALAWNTFNLYQSIKINTGLTATVNLENIFNIHYRPFSSGVSGPGRNLVLGLSLDF